MKIFIAYLLVTLAYFLVVTIMRTRAKEDKKKWDIHVGISAVLFALPAIFGGLWIVSKYDEKLNNNNVVKKQVPYWEKNPWQ